MSRDSSPPPLSDDSAVGSSSSLANNNDRANLAQTLQAPTLQAQTSTAASAVTIQLQHQQPPPQSQLLSSHNQQQQSQPVTKPPTVTRPSKRDFEVQRDELVLAARLMRQNNCSLILKSVRTSLPCFDDLDIRKFETRTSFLINFISNGINDCSTSILRPVSIKWPDTYDRMVDQLATLDVFLLNTGFREKPVEWMLNRGLLNVPNCQQCKEKMVVRHEQNIVRWNCTKTPACGNYFMPIHRPSFFYSFEGIGLDKLLFAVYYWSTCTPGEELYGRMNIQATTLNSVWRRLQNVCRTALDKAYPRHRLTNQLDEGSNLQGPVEPIDLVSIKLNDVFIVCAKHPSSNLVRLGLHIPGVSRYSITDLSSSWFAHAAHVRISEQKFLDLSKTRTDLKLELVPRTTMMTQNSRFYRESAFGYIVCQLSHILRDHDSSTLSRENLKLILAELEWRELHGSTPSQAFTNIIDHMAQYGVASDWYSEPSLPVDGEVSSYAFTDGSDPIMEACEYLWAEKYFYATVDPVDKNGKVISRYTEPPNLENPPLPDVRIACHICSLKFDCFDFALHMPIHVEANRKEAERKEHLRRGLIECKHCFKTFKRHDIESHSELFALHYHQILYGCRICCVPLGDRAQYLQHMRRMHYEHETPYRCPSCKFASSFQRDVFIHFQEEHRQSMVILCPLCLKGFSVAQPEQMNADRMGQLSRYIYNHIAQHYVTSKSFTCSNCSLCFIDKETLERHIKFSHNPLEIHNDSGIKLSPFQVTREEEEYCVKALPNELFIANKRPNLLPIDKKGESSEKDNRKQEPPMIEPLVTMRPARITKSSINEGCSSEKLIDYLSRLKRADGIIANRSVLLTPDSKPAKCCECLEFITVDHFVGSISCKLCKYQTHCPRAATKHKMTKHHLDQEHPMV